MVALPLVLRGWRVTLPLLAILLVGILAASFRTERDQARIERNLAQAEAASLTKERDAANALARSNAEALASLEQRHAVELAALTMQREADAARANALEIRLEALRRDPTHAAPAAAVLRDAIGRLRDARAAGAGAAAGAQPDPAAAATAAQPAAPAGAGQPDAGRGG